MNCPQCGSEIVQGNKFCINCGHKLMLEDAKITEQEAILNDHVENIQDESTEEASSEIQEPEQTALDSSKEDHGLIQEEESLEEVVTPDRRTIFNSDEEKPINKYIRYGSLSIISLLFFGCIFVFFWQGKSEIKVESLIEKNVEKQTVKKLQSIHMLDEELTIYPGNMEEISFYTYPETVDLSKLNWHSSNPNIQVNQSGFILSNQPNATGTITISNADGSIKGETKINVATKEAGFYATLDYINSEMLEDTAVLDYDARYFSVGTRLPESAQGDVSTSLAQINSEIEKYTINQKRFVNKDTKNTVDVDVYSHPETGDIRKIVAIEYLLDDRLDITDYYFMNGKVLFVFKRIENYYRPVAAQQDFVGERAFFDNDALIRWRDIQKSGDGFEKIDYTFNDNKFDWTVYSYKDITKDDVNKEKSNYIRPEDDAKLKKEKQANYLEREQQLINNAYNIYSTVVRLPDITNISGYVLNPQGAPKENITVKIFSEKFELLVGETITNKDGFYSFKVPLNYGNYKVYVDEPSYVSSTIYNIDSNQQLAMLPQEPIYLFANKNDTYTIYLNLVDALSGSLIYEDLMDQQEEPIYNEETEEYDREELAPFPVKVIVRKGINNKTGTPVNSWTVDLRELDQLKLSLKAGTYTAEIQVPGYESNYITISTLENNMTVQSNIVPTISDNEVRVVLTWGSTPNDLDSHMFFPNGDHVSYYKQETSNGILDVDDTSGYGPETITISNLGNSTYKYYVADYTNLSGEQYNSTEMSNSFARVDVYTANGQSTFTIPRNEQAVIWQVFNISNGKIVPVQRLYNNVEDHQWWSSAKE